MPILQNEELDAFSKGDAITLYKKLGAHIQPEGGVYFAVWAPNAVSVSVIGDFNSWNTERSVLQPLGHSGVWAGVVDDAIEGQAYKYAITARNGDVLEKADPFSFCTERPPRTASIIWKLDYEWNDEPWLLQRAKHQSLQSPISIYEVHLGSWRRKVEDSNRPLSYRELADELVAYVKKMNFTHVEIMPVMEHPYGGSWGYQTVSYFAPTRRFGDPQDLMYLIDQLHQAEIGVILDWVPSHFAVDGHGLSNFDGTALYEHADKRQGFHPEWGSNIFNYDRHEVRSFLISNALFWLEHYHIDGLRVDAVSSMLYLDYARKPGEWVPNAEGGRENLGAVRFLRDLNSAVYKHYPNAQMIAEEATAWGGVSRPVDTGGLGFGMKWDMGWMHDTLRYFGREGIHRAHHQNDLTFRSLYAFSENFMLPLSHDEVVHEKKSLISKMAGDEWQKFANLRCLFTYMYASPGKKLLFMGGEIAQWNEWSHQRSLDWHLLEHDPHQQMQKFVARLNEVYRHYPAFHLDCIPHGFKWVDANDTSQSVVAFLRQGSEQRQVVLCVFNLTSTVRSGYRLGVPYAGQWEEILNSDDSRFGGTGKMNNVVTTDNYGCHGFSNSLMLTLPPLAGCILKFDI